MVRYTVKVIIHPPTRAPTYTYLKYTYPTYIYI